MLFIISVNIRIFIFKFSKFLDIIYRVFIYFNCCYFICNLKYKYIYYCFGKIL